MRQTRSKLLRVGGTPDERVKHDSRSGGHPAVVQTAAEGSSAVGQSSTGTAHRPASMSPPMADAGTRVVANAARTNLDISA